MFDKLVKYKQFYIWVETARSIFLTLCKYKQQVSPCRQPEALIATFSVFKFVCTTFDACNYAASSGDTSVSAMNGRTEASPIIQGKNKGATRHKVMAERSRGDS